MSDISKDLARTGYIHIAFSVGSKEKVDSLTAQLKADGYEVVLSRMGITGKKEQEKKESGRKTEGR